MKRAGIAGTAILLVVFLWAVFTPAKAPAEENGAELFQSKGCSQCHYTDSTETKRGPGLKGLFDRDKLPVSGRKVTEENVRKQLTTPYDDMPSYKDRLTKQQQDALIDYLKTL